MNANPAASTPTFTTPTAPILVFYDGDCRVCNHWVNRLIAHDSLRRLRYGSKQGKTFAAFAQLHPEVANVDSIVVVQRCLTGPEATFIRSQAVRVAIVGLPGFKWFATLLAIVPTPLSDFGYALFAKCRRQLARFYRSCRVSQAQPAELFVD